MGIGAAVGATVLGAQVIEKHFTLSRADGGVDSAFSLEPAELKSLVEESERAYLAMGKVQYGIQKQRRIAYFTNDPFILQKTSKLVKHSQLTN